MGITALSSEPDHLARLTKKKSRLFLPQFITEPQFRRCEAPALAVHARAPPLIASKSCTFRVVLWQAAGTVSSILRKDALDSSSGRSELNKAVKWRQDAPPGGNTAMLCLYASINGQLFKGFCNRN